MREVLGNFEGFLKEILRGFLGNFKAGFFGNFEVFLAVFEGF